jgi:ubiquinol-cytochrome c reductase cytochrome c1 subunit
MVRIIGGLVGLGFAFVLAIALFGTISTAITEPEKPTAEHYVHEQHHLLDAGLKSDGPAGKFDRQQLQRGFQVYKEVCAACHSINLVAFRHLEEIGYSEPEVKAIAKQFTVPSINPETGEAATRPAVASDRFPNVYPNEVAARAANNNAIPPDLSLMTKARHDGADYVYSLIGHGYVPQPADLLQKFPEAKTPQGLHYNQYFPNLNIAMPPPLTSEGQVTYSDGTRPTIDQMSKDVSAFLVWTAEPRLEARHTAGWAAVIFIAIFCFLAYGAYLSVWRGVKH